MVYSRSGVKGPIIDTSLHPSQVKSHSERQFYYIVSRMPKGVSCQRLQCKDELNPLAS